MADWDLFTLSAIEVTSCCSSTFGVTASIENLYYSSPVLASSERLSSIFSMLSDFFKVFYTKHFSLLPSLWQFRAGWSAAPLGMRVGTPA